MLCMYPISILIVFCATQWELITYFGRVVFYPFVCSINEYNILANCPASWELTNRQQRSHFGLFYGGSVLFTRWATCLRDYPINSVINSASI